MAPLNQLLAKGVTVALGIDEAGLNDDNDIIQEMRLAMRIHRVPGIDQVGPSSGQILHITTMGGAKTTLFGNRIGSIEKGKGADLVLMDLERLSRPYLDAGHSIVDVVVYRGKMIDVDTVMIAGEVVYKDRKFTRLDKDAIAAQLGEALARDLNPSEVDRRTLGKELMPHVRRFYQGWDMAERQPHSIYSSAI
jgi:cytosine/adenosine deaminase-related metal-dependent hydrolase